MFWLILKFILALYILLHVGEWLVRILSRLAHSLQISSFLLAFLIMALATSIPELIVSLTSAIHKTPQLAVGVLLGTVVASALVLGSDIIISKKSLVIEKSINRRDAWLIAFLAFLPVLLFLDGVLSRFEGAILLLGFLLFSYHIFWVKKRFLKSFRHHHSPFEVPQQLDLTKISRPFHILKYSIFLILGIALLVLSAKYVVFYGQELALMLKLPLIVVGLSFLAFSTTLPELVFETKAIKMARQDLALGDLMGTIVVNSGLIFGLVALIYPIQLTDPMRFIIISLYLFLFLLFLVLNISRPLARWTGFVLVLSYLLFLVVEFYQ